MNSKNNNALDHKCPTCHAPLKFKARLGKWKCDYCRNEFTLDELQKYNNASSEKVNLGSSGDDTQYDSYRCKNCGAEIIAEEHTASTFCVYCRNTAILKTRLSGKFAPTKIIPFKKVREDAIKAFVGLKKGRPLLPSDFISPSNIEKITGLYVPFWLFNIKVEGEILYTAEKIQTWAGSDFISDIQYTKTSSYNISRGGSMEYKLIPVDGSTRFNNEIMNTIEPYDYSELVDYNHAYLSGFISEKYDIGVEECEKDAMNRAKNSANDKVASTILGYSSLKEYSNTMKPSKINHEYALLPVFMVNVKHKNKFYLFAMNGQTGEFIGNMPISFWKTVLYSLLIFSISFALIILISYINFMLAGV